MKKWFFILVLVSLLFLPACETSDNAGSDEGIKENLIYHEDSAGSEGGQITAGGKGTNERPPVIDTGDPDTPVSSDGSAASPPLPTPSGNRSASVPPYSPGSEEIKYLTGQGVYTGMIDPHSIEIMTDEGPLALQIQETVSVNFENMKPGVNVTFQYYTLEQGQNILVRIAENN